MTLLSLFVNWAIIINPLSRLLGDCFSQNCQDAQTGFAEGHNHPINDQMHFLLPFESTTRVNAELLKIMQGEEGRFQIMNKQHYPPMLKSGPKFTPTSVVSKPYEMMLGGVRRK